jgi:hypothetical protein
LRLELAAERVAHATPHPVHEVPSGVTHRALVALDLVLAHRAAIAFSAQGLPFAVPAPAFSTRLTVTAPVSRVLGAHDVHARCPATVGTAPALSSRVLFTHAISPFVPCDHFPDFNQSKKKRLPFFPRGWVVVGWCWSVMVSETMFMNTRPIWLKHGSFSSNRRRLGGTLQKTRQNLEKPSRS